MPDSSSSKRPDARTRLLNAALHLIRAKGYSATRVEDICAAAGLTKGGFFHHFRSKEDMAVAAAAHFSQMAEGLFATASYRKLDDPLERILGYVRFRRSILGGELPEYTCLLGTMVQEAYDTHPEIREACRECIFAHAETLVPDIEAAMAQRSINATWTAQSLAQYTQAVLQGAFILAKASGDASVAAASVDHLYRYLELLFQSSSTQSPKPKRRSHEIH